MSAKPAQTFDEIVEAHSNALNDANWHVLEETGLVKYAPDGTFEVHGISDQNLLPIVENLAFHLSVWIEFAKQIGLPEDKILKLVELGTERGRRVSNDMGEVFTDDDPTN